MVDPVTFRAELARVPDPDRDAWVDLALGVDDPVPDDGPALPPGCVPYLPSPVANLVDAVRGAEIDEHDVVVDVGAGIGRAAAFFRHFTGASTIGLEVQPHLAARARKLAGASAGTGMTTLVGDAVALVPDLTTATVFFLYCPFSGERLARFLDEVEGLARMRTLRLCCVGVAALERPWLRRVESAGSAEVGVYRSVWAGAV